MIKSLIFTKDAAHLMEQTITAKMVHFSLFYSFIITFSQKIIVPVKGHLSKFLKEEIQKIMHHIADISFEKFMLSRMLLFIKEDIKGKIWILWANSLRIEGSVCYFKKLKILLKLFSRLGTTLKQIL